MVRRGLVGAVGALAVLLLAAGTAPAAREIEVGRPGVITARSAGIRFVINELEIVVTCESQFTFELHPRIAKGMASLSGFVREASFRNCQEGNIVALRPSPWHIVYESFTGTLPRITSITFNIINFGYLLTVGGALLRCLYSILGVRTGGGGTSLSPTELEGTLLADLGGFQRCPRFIDVLGTWTLTPAIRATLI